MFLKLAVLENKFPLNLFFRYVLIGIIVVFKFKFRNIRKMPIMYQITKLLYVIAEMSVRDKHHDLKNHYLEHNIFKLILLIIKLS